MSARVITMRDKHSPAVIEALRAEAEAIAAEVDPATLPEGDAGLVEAERRLSRLSARESALVDRFGIDDIPGGALEMGAVLCQTIGETDKRLCEILNERAPQTTAGALAKLRFLSEVIRQDWDVYVVDGEVTALRQVIALLEREARS